MTRRRKREKPVPPAVPSVDFSLWASPPPLRRVSSWGFPSTCKGELTDFEPGCLYTRRGAERAYSQEIEEQLYRLAAAAGSLSAMLFHHTMKPCSIKAQ